MTDKNDPTATLKALATGAQPPRDDDLFAVTSPTDEWAALELRRVLKEAKLRRFTARTAGDFHAAKQLAQTMETLGVAIAELENNQMPHGLRAIAHRIAECSEVHDDFHAESWNVLGREWAEQSAREFNEDAARHEASLDGESDE